MKSILPSYQLKSEKISAVGVDWHIEHVFLSTQLISNFLFTSDSKLYKPKNSFVKFIFFLTGKIPRGKGRAPKAVMPKEEITLETLSLSYENTLQSLHKLQQSESNQYFNHPVFGMLDKKETIRFLNIHINHHLKIIQEILKGNN